MVSMKPEKIIVTWMLTMVAFFISWAEENPFDNNNNGSDTTVNFDMTGYATIGDSTTGGTGGSIITINNLTELETWADTRENNTSPEIVNISGKISSSSSTIITVKHGENISILGLDSTAELEHVGLFIWDYKNVIIRNLKIHEVEYPNDALSISECQYVWVDHCELYSVYTPGEMDIYDGLLDIKKGSKNVTVSWCYLHDHMKTCLIGHTDNETQGVEDSLMRITIHHNYFSNTDGRNPSLRFGAVHYYNNYCENISDYGFAIRKRAHALIENNHYHNVDIPITTDKFDDEIADQGYACLNGNIYSGSCSENDNSITRTDCDFWNDLPYSYYPENANTVSARVKAYAGVGKLHLDPSIIDNTILNPVLTKGIEQVFPNPFNTSTTITFTLPKAGNVRITLSDLSGRYVQIITDNYYLEGENTMVLQRNRLKGGMYFITLTYNSYRNTQKVIIK